MVRDSSHMKVSTNIMNVFSSLTYLFQIGGPLWFSISRSSMRALEEGERSSRIADVEGQRTARLNARKVSNILVSANFGAKRGTLPSVTIQLEERERQYRILDRTQQQISIKNARKVAGLIARYNLFSSSSRSYALALEESERARRINDQESELVAQQNARKVSSLVSCLQAPPTHQANNVSTFTQQTTVIAFKTTKALPPLPMQKAPVREESPILAAPALGSLLVRGAPIGNQAQLDKSASSQQSLQSSTSSTELARSVSFTEPAAVSPPITNIVPLSGPLQSSTSSVVSPIYSSPSTENITTTTTQLTSSTTVPAPVTYLATQPSFTTVVPIDPLTTGMFTLKNTQLTPQLMFLH